MDNERHDKPRASDSTPCKHTKPSSSGTYGVRSLVEFDRAVGTFGLAAQQDHLADLLRPPVELGTQASLKPRFRRQVEQDLRCVLQAPLV